MMRSKKELRLHFKELRKGISSTYKKRFDSKITHNVIEYLKSTDYQNIACYWGSDKLIEVDTLEILNFILSNKILGLPFIESRKGVMTMRQIMNLNDLSITFSGIAQPNETDKPMIPELILTPLLAVDKRGYRLGYGGGFYDRYFAKHKNAYLVGLTYEKFLLDTLPNDQYDIPLHAIITEDRFLTF